MKRFGGLVALVALAAAGLFAAFAAFGPAPAAQASGNGSVAWTGQGSNSVTACAAGQQPYLHWIFTTGGAQGNTVSAVTLTLGGSGSGSYAMSQHGLSWTADTGYYDLAGLTAVATYTGQLGSGASNLVISDGCYGATTGTTSTGTTSTGTTSTVTTSTGTTSTATTATATTATTATTAATATTATTGTSGVAGTTTATTATTTTATTTGPLTPPTTHHHKHHGTRHRKARHHEQHGRAHAFRPPKRLPHTL